MQLKQQIFDFRFPIADLWVCDALGKKRPTPMEFYKSAIGNVLPTHRGFMHYEM